MKRSICLFLCMTMFFACFNGTYVFAEEITETVETTEENTEMIEVEEEVITEEETEPEAMASLFSDDGLETLILYPEATIHVQDASNTKNKNFKDSAILAIGRGRFSYLRFDLTPLKGKMVLSATFRCYKNDTNSNQVGAFYVPDDTWTEDMTYNTRPSLPTVNPSGVDNKNTKVDNEERFTTVDFKGGSAREIACDFTDIIYEENAKEDDDKLSFMLYPVNIGISGGSSIYANEVPKNSENVDPAKMISIEVTYSSDPDQIDAIKDLRELDLGDLSNVTDNLVLPTEGSLGSSISWQSSDESLINGEGVVNRPLYADGDKTVTLTATAIKNDATYTVKFTLTIKKRELTPEDRIGLDKGAVLAFDEITTIADLDLPFEGEYGTKISYQSSNEEVVSNTGKITRPKEGEPSETVTLTVTMEYEGIFESFDITVFVPAPQVYNSETMRKSAADIYAYLSEYLTNIPVGTAPGEVNESDKTDTLSDILSIYEKINSESTYFEAKNASERMTLAVLGLLDTIVTSDAVTDAKKNTLEFSSYRVELMKEVVQSEVALLTEPDMYTEGSKYALRDYLRHCYSVLDGTYEVPFTRTREFVAPRPDEDIQFALKHYSKTYPGLNDGGYYGIINLRNWYYTQYMLKGTTQAFEIAPDGNVHIQGGSNSGKNFYTEMYDQVVIGNERWGLFKLDLNKINGNVESIKLRIQNISTNNFDIDVYHVPDEYDGWDEKTVTLNSWTAMTGGKKTVGNLIKTFRPGGKAAVDIDFTEAAKSDVISGNGIFTVIMERRPNYQYPINFASSRADDENTRARFLVETDITDYDNFTAKYEEIYNKAAEMYDNAVVGDGVGEYPEETYKNLEKAIFELKNAFEARDVLVSGKAMVKVFNAMRDMRFNQVLRQDVEPFSNAFFSQEDLVDFATKVSKYPILQNEYNYLKQLSDQMSMEDVDRLFWIMNEDVPRETVNQYFKLLNGTGNFSFKAPANTAYGTLEIYLPEAEYEDPNDPERLGHIWIDDIKIVSTVSTLEIENASFELGNESPDDWTVMKYSGNPKVEFETRPNYVQTGGRSIYIENTTKGDSGGIKYNHRLELAANESYTASFVHKVDDKFKGKGVAVKVNYYDKNGNYLSNYIGYANKKTSKGQVLNEAQADAIVYAVTGDIYYAEKAKKRLIYSANDFAQGAEYWLINNARPNDIDAYGQVQGGRILASICAAYTLIKDAGVFTEEEYEKFTRTTDYIAQFLMDPRERWEDDYVRATAGTNWNTDMANGSLIYGISFPDAKDARLYFTNGALVLRGHLDNQVYADGSWPESIRYVGAVINKFAPAARVMNIANGTDWYAETKLSKMYEYLLSVQTPPYIYFNNQVATPPIGDHTLTGSVYGPLGIYYDQVQKSNPELAAHMYKTWTDAGMPMMAYSGEAISLQNFFSPVSFETEGNYPLVLDDYFSPNVGLYIFRENFGRDNAKMVTMVSNDTALGHGHPDQGSFMLFANSLPLIMDPGIVNYFDATNRWYAHSPSHACLLMSADGVNIKEIKVSTRDKIFQSDELNTIRVTNDYANVGNDKRTLAMLEDGFNALIVWDQVEGASHPTIFNLPVVAKSSEITGNTVMSYGHYGTNVRTTVLEPATPNITTSWGQSTEMMPKINGEYKQNYVESKAAKNENHLVIIEPLKAKEAGLTITNLATANAKVTGYKLQKLNGDTAVILANDASTSATVTVDVSENLIDIKTGKEYSPNSIKVEGNDLLILKAKSVKAPEISKIEIQGSQIAYIPSVGEADEKYTGYVVSQYNNTMAGKQVKWSLESGSSVRMTSDGILHVSADAKPYEKVVISAKVDNIERNFTVNLMPYESRSAEAVIEGPEKIAIPDEGTVAVPFKAIAYDNYGKEIEDEFSWKLNNEVAGVYLKDGVLYVSSDAQNDTEVILIAGSKSSITATASKTVVVENIKGDDIKFDGKIYIASPESGVKTYDCNADVVDQNGNPYGSGTVDFEIENAPDGVTVTPDGKLTVPAGLTDGAEITLKLTSSENEELSRIITLYINKNAPDSIEINGSDEIGVPSSGTKTYQYTATVVNCLGSEVNAPVTFALESVPAGVVFSKNGSITLQRTTASCKIKLTAYIEGIDGVKAEKEITIINTNPVSVPSGGGGGAGGGYKPSGGGSGGNSGGGGTIISAPYADINSSHWAYNDVIAMTNRGIINGESGNFYPERNITRAEFAKIITSAITVDENSEESIEFSDVAEDSWYYSYINKAVSAGLVKGYEDGTFRPDEYITREQIATILSRVIGISEADPEETFADDNDISDYAKDAVYYMKKVGVINGYPENLFMPQLNATRAEAAVMTERFVKLNSK